MSIENQKIRLVKLWELLRLNTDEDHPMTTNEILKLLSNESIIAISQNVFSIRCV
jgi:hypothetical protein